MLGGVSTCVGVAKGCMCRRCVCAHVQQGCMCGRDVHRCRRGACVGGVCIGAGGVHVWEVCA